MGRTGAIRAWAVGTVCWACSVAAATAAGQLSFDPDGVRLVSGNQSLSPAEVYEEPRERHDAGELVLEFGPRSVRARRPGQGAAAWSVTYKAGEGFEWLGNDAETIYLRKWAMEGGRMQPADGAAVWRMSAKDGAWLAPVKPDPDAPAGAAVDVVALEVVTGGAVTMTSRGGGGGGGGTAESYRIAMTAGEKVTWAKEYPVTGRPPAPGARVLGPFGPPPITPDVKRLSLAGSQVIACGGPSEPVIALDLKTGRENWKLEDVWEFDRGYTGPALLQFFMARGGDVNAITGEGPRVEAAARKAMRETCSLVGGPLVVPYGNGHRLFLATARHDKRAVGYLAECRVYEVSARGNPVAVATMPRLILGGNYKLLEDGVLWGFEGDAFAKFVPTDQQEVVGNAVQGTDHLVRMEWYRQPAPVVAPAAVPGAWLTTGTAGNPVGLDGTLLARLPSGGYVQKEGDKVFHFPVELIDLGTGRSQRWTVDVPTGEAIAVPNTNFSKRNGQIVTRGPHQLAVVGLEVNGKDLYVRVASEGMARIFRFDVSKAAP